MKIDRIQFFRIDAPTKTFQEVDGFGAGDGAQFFQATLGENLPAKTKVKWLWYIHNPRNSSLDAQIFEYAAEVPETKILNSRMELMTGWPIGPYKGELYIDDKIATTFTYDVAGEALKVIETTLHSDNEGALGAVLDAFPPTQHVQHFRVRLNGIVPANATLTWVFNALETEGGNDIEIFRLETPPDGLVDIITTSLSLQTDFPKGKYRADFAVNGKLLTQIAYVVA